jgi:hypothetical protein
MKDAFRTEWTKLCTGGGHDLGRGRRVRSSPRQARTRSPAVRGSTPADRPAPDAISSHTPVSEYFSEDALGMTALSGLSWIKSWIKPA